MSSSVRGAGGGGPSEAKKISYDNTESGVNSENVQDAIDELEETKADKAELTDKAPMYSYGTTDLEAGVSPLEAGKLYFVYE